ncbi:M24 family metallopeptidase [Bradyrhizobium centrosematis]|uniref:M24 family metallopeptidase n=1 Tax=Bradyrhizobium centrosematis TaxID=1300039 RepID=UPI00389094F8
MHKEEPTFIVRPMDAAAAIYQSFLDRASMVIYPEKLVGNPDTDVYDAVIDFLHDAGLAKSGVGLEGYQLPARAAEKFKRRLPQARIIDVNRTVTWVRTVKSNLEIAVMKEVAAISDAAIMRAKEVIRPGVREPDVVAELLATLARGVNGKAGTSLPHVFLNAGPRSATSHICWTEETIERGTHVNLELSGFRYAYAAPLSRTFSIGVPSDHLRRVHEAQRAGLEAALNAVRPGATCSDVAGAAYRAIEKRGFSKVSRCGYAVGIDWVEQTASLNELDKTELKPNMTFHLILSNWMMREGDFGYVLSQTIRVTESGVETLSAVPPKLFEI